MLIALRRSFVSRNCKTKVVDSGDKGFRTLLETLEAQSQAILDYFERRLADRFNAKCKDSPLPTQSGLRIYEQTGIPLPRTFVTNIKQKRQPFLRIVLKVTRQRLELWTR